MTTEIIDHIQKWLNTTDQAQKTAIQKKIISTNYNTYEDDILSKFHAALFKLETKKIKQDYNNAYINEKDSLYEQEKQKIKNKITHHLIKQNISNIDGLKEILKIQHQNKKIEQYQNKKIDNTMELLTQLNQDQQNNTLHQIKIHQNPFHYTYPSKKINNEILDGIALLNEMFNEPYLKNLSETKSETSKKIFQKITQNYLKKWSTSFNEECFPVHLLNTKTKPMQDIYATFEIMQNLPQIQRDKDLLQKISTAQQDLKNFFPEEITELKASTELLNKYQKGYAQITKTCIHQITAPVLSDIEQEFTQMQSLARQQALAAQLTRNKVKNKIKDLQQSHDLSELQKQNEELLNQNETLTNTNLKLQVNLEGQKIQLLKQASTINNQKTELTAKDNIIKSQNAELLALKEQMMQMQKQMVRMQTKASKNLASLEVVENINYQFGNPKQINPLEITKNNNYRFNNPKQTNQIEITKNPGYQFTTSQKSKNSNAQENATDLQTSYHHQSKPQTQENKLEPNYQFNMPKTSKNSNAQKNAIDLQTSYHHQSKSKYTKKEMMQKLRQARRTNILMQNQNANQKLNIDALKKQLANQNLQTHQKTHQLAKNTSQYINQLENELTSTKQQLNAKTEQLKQNLKQKHALELANTNLQNDTKYQNKLLDHVKQQYNQTRTNNNLLKQQNQQIAAKYNNTKQEHRNTIDEMTQKHQEEIAKIHNNELKKLKKNNIINSLSYKYQPQLKSQRNINTEIANNNRYQYYPETAKTPDKSTNNQNNITKSNLETQKQQEKKALFDKIKKILSPEQRKKLTKHIKTKTDFIQQNKDMTKYVKKGQEKLSRILNSQFNNPKLHSPEFHNSGLDKSSINKNFLLSQYNTNKHKLSNKSSLNTILESKKNYDKLSNAQFNKSPESLLESELFSAKASKKNNSSNKIILNPKTITRNQETTQKRKKTIPTNKTLKLKPTTAYRGIKNNKTLSYGQKYQKMLKKTKSKHIKTKPQPINFGTFNAGKFNTGPNKKFKTSNNTKSTSNATKPRWK